MSKSLMPFDELNVLTRYVTVLKESGGRIDKKEIKDDLEDLLILAYLLGIDQANEDLGTSVEPNSRAMHGSVFALIEGKSFADRLDEYITDDSVDVASVVRVAETETHRVFNEAILQGGEEAGAKQKKWVTMMDDRVRDTHDYLEGMVVGFNERFYTFDGDSAKYPGGFSSPSNNINCRCRIELSADPAD